MVHRLKEVQFKVINDTVTTMKTEALVETLIDPLIKIRSRHSVTHFSWKQRGTFRYTLVGTMVLIYEVLVKKFGYGLREVGVETVNERMREIITDLQWRTKFLGQLTRSALIFPPFPLSPKQCCSLCTPVDFTLS